MTTIEKTEYGIILSQFDGEQWHREVFNDNDELAIWAHKNKVCLVGIDV